MSGGGEGNAQQHLECQEESTSLSMPGSEQQTNLSNTETNLLTNEQLLISLLEETTTSSGVIDLSDQQLPKFEELQSASIRSKKSLINIRTTSYSIQIITNFIML